MSRRVGQRALDELRRQTMMLVDTSEGAPGAGPPPATTTTAHDPACQLAVTSRLDGTCQRCQGILAIADS